MGSLRLTAARVMNLYRAFFKHLRAASIKNNLPLQNNVIWR